MRETCWRCFWPKGLCWCASITPMATRTRWVILMHPKEFKREKAATGRLAHLCLADSEIHMGVGFDGHPAVEAILDDPRLRPVLLYPGEGAVDLSAGESLPPDPEGRRLVVFLLDGTWSLAKKMLRSSRRLQALPRVVFSAPSPGRWLIKQQPRPECLATIEAAHELLLVLERAGLDRYPLPDQMCDLFRRMQEVQIRCAADPTIPGYRRRAYRPPGERSMPSSWSRRATPAPAPSVSPEGSTSRTLPSFPT